MEVTVWRRLLLYVAGLAVVFASAFGLGAAAGPFDQPVPSHDGGHEPEAGQ